MKDLTVERDTLKGQVTSVTAERDAAVKEREFGTKNRGRDASN